MVQKWSTGGGLVSWPADGEPRYVVVECRGYLSTYTSSRRGRAWGVSAIVADRGRAHRTVAEFRTEDVLGPVSPALRLARTRRRAHALADRLNAGSR